jgi:hypothetical protein
MPKYNQPTQISGEEKPVVASKSTTAYNNTISVQSLFPAHLKYTGRKSGKEYEWFNPGDVVAVNSEDVPELLSKTIGERLCCGNQPNSVFQIVGG